MKGEDRGSPSQGNSTHWNYSQILSSNKLVVFPLQSALYTALISEGVAVNITFAFICFFLSIVSFSH